LRAHFLTLAPELINHFIAMPSFDIVNKIDTQTLDNVINLVKKEITTRYDFRDSKTTIELDKKDLSIHILTENEMRIKSIEDVMITRMAKQGMNARSLDFGKEQYASGNMVKKDVKVKQGLDKEEAKKIVKAIKDMKLKVEPAIMDDQVRVTAKKIDDLQAVISGLRKLPLEMPLQFVNMK
jgi:cyclic-di-GMP-binding protein